MRVKEQKLKEKVLIDPVLFAASVPARKATAKDVADCEEQPADAIEPKEYDTMDSMVEDL